MKDQVKPIKRGSTKEVFSREEINSSSTDVKSVLSKIFRKLVYSSGRNPIQKWQELMDEFIKEQNKAVALSSKKVSYTRGNTKHELTNGKMTWSVFCKGLKFLRFTKFRIIVIATTEDGKEFFSDETVNIASNIYDDEEDVFIPDTGVVPKDQHDQWLSELIESNRHK